MQEQWDGGVDGVSAVMKKTRAGPRKAAWNLAAVSRATAIDDEIRSPLHKTKPGPGVSRDQEPDGPESGSASDRSAGQPPEKKRIKQWQSQNEGHKKLHQ